MRLFCTDGSGREILEAELCAGEEVEDEGTPVRVEDRAESKGLEQQFDILVHQIAQAAAHTQKSGCRSCLGVQNRAKVERSAMLEK